MFCPAFSPKECSARQGSLPRDGTLWNGDVESPSAAPAGSLRHFHAQPAGMLKPLLAYFTSLDAQDHGEDTKSIVSF
jgi:hypothetical protein